MKGKFYVVGVGPGDPDLVTRKAIKILEACPVWVVPKGNLNGESTALRIVEGLVSNGKKEILEHFFPMKKVHRGDKVDPELEKSWLYIAQEIFRRIEQGQDVVFLTLGDPAIYSTGFYVVETLKQLEPGLKIKIIPGVSSIGASSAASGLPLCLGDEKLVVIPATYENSKLQEILEMFDTVVLMKVHRVLGRIVGLLGEMDLLDKAVLVERCSQSGERIRRDLEAAALEEHHYFSTMIVRKL